MFCEIHGDKVESSHCLLPHTQQGICSICVIKQVHKTNVKQGNQVRTRVNQTKMERWGDSIAYVYKSVIEMDIAHLSNSIHLLLLSYLFLHN